MGTVLYDVSGYAVKFSPVQDFHAVVASMTNPSIDNVGRYDIVDFTPIIPLTTTFGMTHPHTFDCTWSRSNPDLIVLASKDGGSHIIDVSPIRGKHKLVGSYYGHSDSVVSVDWNPNNSSFITASLDRTVRLWFVDRIEQPQKHAHTAPVNCAIWNPRNPDQYASASDDHKVRIWDTRVREATLTFDADDACSICTCDWNQHGTLVATGATGRNYVKVWDLRQTTEPAKDLLGDPLGYVIKVKFSRHRDNQVASSLSNGKVVVCEYDAGGSIVWRRKYSHHYGPVRGLDMSERIDGLMTSTGEDGYVHMWLHTIREASSFSRVRPPSSSSRVQE